MDVNILQRFNYFAKDIEMKAPPRNFFARYIYKTIKKINIILRNNSKELPEFDEGVIGKYILKTKILFDDDLFLESFSNYEASTDLIKEIVDLHNNFNLLLKKSWVFSNYDFNIIFSEKVIQNFINKHKSLNNPINLSPKLQKLLKNEMSYLYFMRQMNGRESLSEAEILKSVPEFLLELWDISPEKMRKNFLKIYSESPKYGLESFSIEDIDEFFEFMIFEPNVFNRLLSNSEAEVVDTKREKILVLRIANVPKPYKNRNRSFFELGDEIRYSSKGSLL